MCPFCLFTPSLLSPSLSSPPPLSSPPSLSSPPPLASTPPLSSPLFPPLSSPPHHTTPHCTTQLKDLELRARLRLILQLGEQLPCIDAVVISIHKKPRMRIEYKLKAIGGQLSSIPGLAGMIESTVHSAIESTLMWPERIVVPLAPSFDASFLEMHYEGSLVVTAWKAEGLKNVDMMSVSDPFAILWTHGKHKAVTRTIDNDLNPVWNETFELPVDDIHTAELFIQVDDEDSFGSQNLGYAMYPLVGLLDKDTVQTVTLTLLPKLNNDRMLGIDHKLGRITLQMVYRSYTPEEKVQVTAAEKARDPKVRDCPLDPDAAQRAFAAALLSARHRKLSAASASQGKRAVCFSAQSGEGDGAAEGEGHGSVLGGGEGGGGSGKGEKGGGGSWWWSWLSWLLGGGGKAGSGADGGGGASGGDGPGSGFRSGFADAAAAAVAEAAAAEAAEAEAAEAATAEEEETEDGDADADYGDGSSSKAKDGGAVGGRSSNSGSISQALGRRMKKGEGQSSGKFMWGSLKGWTGGQKAKTRRKSGEGGWDVVADKMVESARGRELKRSFQVSRESRREGGGEEWEDEDWEDEEEEDEEEEEEEESSCVENGEEGEIGMDDGESVREQNLRAGRLGAGSEGGDQEDREVEREQTINPEPSIEGCALQESLREEGDGSGGESGAGEGRRNGEMEVEGEGEGAEGAAGASGGAGASGRDGQGRGVGAVSRKREVRRLLLGAMLVRKNIPKAARSRTRSADAADAGAGGDAADAANAALTKAADVGSSADGAGAGDGGDGGDGGGDDGGGGLRSGHDGEGGGVGTSLGVGGWNAVMDGVVELVEEQERELKRSLQVSRRWRFGSLGGEEEGKEEEDGEEAGGAVGSLCENNKEESGGGMADGQASKVGGAVRKRELRSLLLGALLERKDSPRGIQASGDLAAGDAGSGRASASAIGAGAGAGSGSGRSGEGKGLRRRWGTLIESSQSSTPCSAAAAAAVASTADAPVVAGAAGASVVTGAAGAAAAAIAAAIAAARDRRVASSSTAATAALLGSARRSDTSPASTLGNASAGKLSNVVAAESAAGGAVGRKSFGGMARAVDTGRAFSQALSIISDRKLPGKGLGGKSFAAVRRVGGGHTRSKTAGEVICLDADETVVEGDETLVVGDEMVVEGGKTVQEGDETRGCGSDGKREGHGGFGSKAKSFAALEDALAGERAMEGDGEEGGGEEGDGEAECDTAWEVCVPVTSVPVTSVPVGGNVGEGVREGVRECKEAKGCGPGACDEGGGEIGRRVESSELGGCREVSGGADCAGAREQVGSDAVLREGRERCGEEESNGERERSGEGTDEHMREGGGGEGRGEDDLRGERHEIWERGERHEREESAERDERGERDEGDKRAERGMEDEEERGRREGEDRGGSGGEGSINESIRSRAGESVRLAETEESREGESGEGEIREGESRGEESREGDGGEGESGEQMGLSMERASAADSLHALHSSTACSAVSGAANRHVSAGSKEGREFPGGREGMGDDATAMSESATDTWHQGDETLVQGDETLEQGDEGWREGDVLMAAGAADCVGEVGVQGVAGEHTERRGKALNKGKGKGGAWPFAKNVKNVGRALRGMKGGTKCVYSPEELRDRLDDRREEMERMAEMEGKRANADMDLD
ncbi:unnamed protein product [Closterium sp. NIES-65]|nr:unnamed protein product [Closterium sp. NIES-65]